MTINNNPLNNATAALVTLAARVRREMLTPAP